MELWLRKAALLLCALSLARQSSQVQDSRRLLQEYAPDQREDDNYIRLGLEEDNRYNHASERNGDDFNNRISQEAVKKHYRTESDSDEGDDDFKFEEGNDDFDRMSIEAVKKHYNTEGDDDFRFEEGNDDFRFEEGNDDFRFVEGDDDFMFEDDNGNRREKMVQEELAETEKEKHSGAKKPMSVIEDDYRNRDGLLQNKMIEELAEMEKEKHTSGKKTPRKVTFEDSHVMIEMMKQMTETEDSSKDPPDVNEDDDDDALSQWVMVTSEGYEYDPTPDEVNQVFQTEDSSENLSSERSDSQFDANVNQGGIEASFNATDQKIFGRDNRRRVYNTRYYPWAAIGRVDTGCTGTFIGPRHVLTSGHCVYNPWSKKWRKNLNFRRGRNGYRPGILYRWKYAVTVWGWIRGNKRYDYAVIVVTRSSPTWMSFGWRRPMPRYIVNIAGYPADKGVSMYHSHCRLKERYYNMMRYRCDTYSGMSGSAVYVNFGRYKVIYGIHRGYTWWGRNECVRINKRRYKTIRYIKRKYR